MTEQSAPAPQPLAEARPQDILAGRTEYRSSRHLDADRADLLREREFLLSQITRLREQSSRLEAVADRIAADRARLRTELAARPSRAAVLRETADEMDAICEQHGVFGVGDIMRRKAAEADPPA
ncbi:hypothetical protein [Streptomyces sp. NPDC049879]|uniref:hypothetical protein n=1 Tax=Streptomyces sp. NPDC049879 TaxID=3365598 RepID=UPI0037B3F155